MQERFQTLETRTSWGTVQIRAIGGHAVRCALPFLADAPSRPFRVGRADAHPASRFVAAALTGREAELPPLGKIPGTPFQQAVWAEIARIPRGETRTYGELARAIGRPGACRAVAGACGQNPLPLFVPCHRVVAANGKPGGFSPGLPWKRLLLEAEQRPCGK